MFSDRLLQQISVEAPFYRCTKFPYFSAAAQPPSQIAAALPCHGTTLLLFPAAAQSGTGGLNNI
jgi:hypothetical protein